MAKVLWSEVESRPWFTPLPPEEKAKVLDQWTQDTLAEAQSDEEKLLLEASSDAIKKTYFGEPMPTDFMQYVQDFGLRKAQQKVQQEAERDLPFISLADTASALGDVFRGLPPTLKASYYQITESGTRPDKRSDAYKQAMAERDAFLDSLQQVPEGQKTDVGEAIRGAAGSIGFTGIAAGSALAAGAVGRAVGTRVGGAVGGTLGGAAGAPAGGVGAIPGAATGTVLGSTAGGAVGQKLGQYIGGLLGAGTAAYKLAYEDFRHEAFKQAEQNKGAPLTDEEAEQLDQQIKPLAENTAAWEAGPEAVGTVVSLGTAKALYGLTKDVMTNLGRRTLGRLAKAGAIQAGGTGVELTTEAITQYNQAYDQAKLAALLQGRPLEEAVKPYEGFSGLIEAGKEVAPTVLALQGLLGGGAALAGKLTSKKPTELTESAFREFVNEQQAAAIANRENLEGQAEDPEAATPSIFKRVRAKNQVEYLDLVREAINKGDIDGAASMMRVKIISPEQAARNAATPPSQETPPPGDEEGANAATPPPPPQETPPPPPPVDEEAADAASQNPAVQAEKEKASKLSGAAADADANNAPETAKVAAALAENKNAQANALIEQLLQGVRLPTFGQAPMAGPLQSAARPAPVVSPAVEDFRTSLDELMQASDRAGAAVQQGDVEGARAILTNAQAALSLPPQYLNSLSPEDQTQVQTLAAEASARLGQLLGSLPADEQMLKQDAALVVYELTSPEIGEALDLDEIEMALDNVDRQESRGRSMDWARDTFWLPNLSTSVVAQAKNLLSSPAGRDAIRQRIAEKRAQAPTPTESLPTVQPVAIDIANQPSPNLAPRATENAPPRPVRQQDQDYREFKDQQDEWDYTYGRTHNEDGTPYQPTVLDETLTSASKALASSSLEERIDAVGADIGAEFGSALTKILNDGWVWDAQQRRAVDPQNRGENPRQALAQLLNDGWVWDAQQRRMVDPQNRGENPRQALARIRGETAPSAQQSLPAGQAQAPAAGQQPATPQTNAPQERQIPEGGQPKRVDVDEGGPTPETGGGNRLVEGREVSEEDVTALAAVASNTATPEQVRDLVSKKLVREVGGQPVIRDAALGVLPEGQRPPLTETQRVAELTKEPVRRTEILRFQIQQRSDNIKKGWTEDKFAAANSFFITGDPKELETLTKAQREVVLRVAANYDQEGKKSKVPRATQRTKGSTLSKALAEMPDPDNPDAQNIIARIARRGGRILKPSAAWLARQKKEGTPYTRGDWDAINNLNLPFYYSNLLFEAGAGSGLDQALIALAGEGYFPGYTAETITPEVFAEKLARTIDAYNKVLAGLPSNAVEEAEAMVARDEADRLEFEGFIFGKEGTVVDPETLRVGDKLTINGDVMTVTNLQFPEVETAKRPDFIELTGVRYGRQLVSTENEIRAEAIERTAPPVDEFALEAPTAEGLKAEAETQRQRQQIREGQGARLTGTAGEMGTPDMFDVTAGEAPLFSQPLERPQTPEAAAAPAVQPTPETAAAPVVAQEPAVSAQQPTTEKLAKVRAKRDELFSRFRRKAAVQFSMSIDPEFASIAAEIAGTYVEEGVVRFADFAARVKADAGDLWNQLRRYLHGAWTSNGTVNTALDEVTRAQAADILDQLDAAEQAEPVVDEIPPVENTDPVPTPSPVGEPPTPDERNAKLGFGQRKRRSINQLLADGDQNYLFETLFDEAQMAAAMRSSPADVPRVRDVVRRLPEYAEYQVEKAKTPDQRREENAPLAEQTQQDVAALNNIAGFTTSIAADGRVQVSDYPDVYKPMLTRNGFVFDPAAQAFVNPNYSKVLGFVQELRDDIAGLTTTKQNRTPDGQYRARARALQQSETNEAVIPAEVFQQTIGARVKALIMRGLFGDNPLPEDVLVDQIHDVALMTKAQQDGKPMFMLSSGTGTGKTYVLAGFIAEMRRLGVSGKIIFVTRSKALADQNRKEMAPFLEDTGNLQELINAAPVEQRQEVVDSWLRRNPKAAEALQKAVDTAAESNIEELALEEAIDRFGGKGLFFQVVDGAIATFRRVSGRLRPVGGYPIKGRLGELRPDWNFLKPVVLGENGQILPLSERFGTPEEQDAAYLDQLTVPNDPSVDFMSYADIDNAEKFAPTESDIIIFDEAHEIRYNGEDVPSDRSKKAEAWIRKSKFTVFSTATPVESVQQMRFLWPTGVFNLLPGDRPYGNEEGDWFNFVAAAGGKVLVSTDGKPKSTEFPADTQVEDTMFARDFLYKKGMMAQRVARIPAEMVDTTFSEVEGTKQWADLANTIMEVGKGMGKIDRSTKAYITHLLKRVLEQSKMEAGAQLALREAELGRQVVLFVETRSERERNLPELVEIWDAAKRDKTPLPKDFSPKMEGAIELFRRLIAAGVTEINFPSVQDVFRKSLGDKVTFYTGEETGKTGDNNLGRWRNGEVPILVSTYQRGGTGLSLHDKSKGGVAPRSQIVLALPWRATETEQLLGRIVRYGMTSKANVFMLFANNIANENSLAAKVAGRLNSMSLFVRGAPSDTGNRINSWEFDPLQNVFEPVVELPALPMPTDGAAQEIVETAQLESSAQPAASAKPTDRVVGNVSMESMNAGLSKLARLFPRIRNIVRIDTLANLLADPNISDGEKDELRQGAQGIYYRGRIFVAQDNVRQTIFHKNQEVAAMAVIFHELMHLGADVIRSSPQLRSLYARWNSMLSSFVSETDMDALVRQGYDKYANWREDPEKELRLREEMFVRKLENLLNRKGAEFFGPEGNMVRTFIEWLRDLLNRVFGLASNESMTDSVLLEWGREFTRAANLAGYYRYIQDVNVRDVIMQSLVRSDAGYLRLVEGGDSGTDNLSALVKAAPAEDRASVIEQWTQRNPQSAAEMQRMVDEAAKAAGYNVGPVFHGTTRKKVKYISPSKAVEIPGAAFLTDNEDMASEYTMPREYGEVIYEDEDGNEIEPGIVVRAMIRLNNPKVVDMKGGVGDTIIMSKAVREAKAAGNDGVIFENVRDGMADSDNEGISYAVFESSQIKSADPITYDDQGNVIPLSERFQTISPDIRRSAAPLEGMELPAGNGTPRTGLETLTKEEEALFEAFQKQGKIESSLKLTQVLGFRNSGNVNARETLMPLKGEAMATIGFDEDAMGRPIVTEEASANARRIALQLLNPATGFGERYQNQFGPESAATAVLQLELVRYGMAMLQKGDYSLLGMLRTNMNSVVLGAYATATFAGRILAARRFYVSDVLRTIEEYNSLAEKAILKSYLKAGATEDEARDAAKAIRDAVEQAELTEEQLRNLRDAFEKKPEAEKLESQAPDILERISRGLETVSTKTASVYKALTSELLRITRLEEALKKAKSASAADKNVSASFFVEPDESAFPTDVASLEAMLAESVARAEELGRQLEAEMAPPKRKKRPTTGTKIPAPKEEPTEDEQQIEETEDVNEATAAAQRVLEELKAFLDRKFSNKAPKPTIYDFIRKLVNNRIANSEELTYPQFLERINAELGGMDIAPEVLEELVTKAWTVFKRHPIKNAEKISARFQKLLGDWTPYRRQLPAKTEQLQALVQRFVRNPDGLELGEFMDQMVPQLEALGLSEELSNKLAEDTFNEFGRRIEEKATNRFNTIREALIERAKEKPLGTNSEGDPSDRLWRMDTLRTVLEESGLSDEEIANALPRFTQSDLEYFFGETPPENLTPRVRNSRIERVRRRYEESLKRPKEEKTSIARQDNIRRLLRRQLRIPASQNTFVAQAAMFGATVEQANELFRLTEQERALYVTEQGRSPTVLSKLIEYIRSAPAAIRNQPQNRNAAIRDFLESNGFDKTQIRAAMPWITREFNKFIAQAKEKALAAEAKRIEDNLKRSEARRTVSQTEKLLSLIKKDLELVRTGLGTVIENSGAVTEPDPMEVIAKRLGFEGFRPEDYQSLSDLDATITRALEDGRAHDMARGLKELYDLMGRRKAPKTFMQQLAVSYNNSALSGVGTLAINVVAPGGALAVRAALDMFKHLSRGNLKGVADVQQIMLDSMKNIVREVEFSLVGGANLNAMQAMIGRETNLQPELRDNLAKYRNKKLSPQARLFAGFRVLMAYTDLTRRLLGTTDHVWYVVMQNYFLKTQGLKELTNAGIPREKAMALLFNQTQETSSLLQSELTTITNLETALNEASDAELGNKVSEFLKAEIAENTPDDLRVFEEDFKAAIRRTFVAYQNSPTKARKNLMAEIRLQKSASFLRANDRNKKAMKANIVGLMDPSKQAEVQNNLDVAEIKETEFEMGTHRGEESPNWDVANILSVQVQKAGSTVLRDHPILGRMLLGYFGIPLNLLNRSLWFTPYGLIRYGIAKKYMATPEGRATFYQQSMNSQAQIRQRFVEAMVGTAASIALLALQALGDEDDNLLEVTLAGPINKAEYDAWYKAGHRRNSLEFNVGGVRAVLNYGRGPLESLKIALILAGAVNDMRLNRKLGEDQTQFDLAGYLGAVLSGWNQQASFFGAKTTIGATLSVQPDANVLGTALYKLNPVIPFSGLISSVEKFITGPNQFRGRQGALFMNLPLARSLLTERAVNPLGDPVGLSLKDPFSQTLERLWYAGMPMTITTPLSGRDAQIYQFILDRGIAPGLPQRSALEAKNGLMWDNEWQRYVEVRGQFLKEDLARNLARFSRMSDDDLSKAMGELSTRATKQAKRYFRYQ